jgi:hypothetical protein
MIKQFTHLGVANNNLATHEINGQRWYILPDGKSVPSITTVLSYFESESLQKWKDRVGEEESNRVKYRATTRGTQIHELIEQYLDNRPPLIARPDLFQMFKDMQPALNRIDNIYCQESVLYCDKAAGRCDVIAEFDGVPSIIDFKTSTKLKQDKYITNYKEQTSKYKSMFEENTGIRIDQTVIIIGVDNEPEPQIFIQKKDEVQHHLNMFNLKLDTFWGKHSAYL